VMSYDGRVCWGLVADRDSVPDLGALARDLEAAFEELREASRRARPDAPPPEAPGRRVRQRSAATPSRSPGRRRRPGGGVG
jgi:hypothetical protein